MNKRKRYWILIPPFLIIMLTFFLTLPNPHKGLSISVALIFWITLWIWNYFGDEKQKKTERNIN
ncbi:hypothetical protein IMZ08_17375 [Bacillus luteolus]|uniref:Permease n=1 Tax=Litchfieldia luteola TaxID=682179 RepID=A0ABR9QMS8_9BACI|nr:hypothetical protein [Cytobacillus luteolus]MBE4909808.1 hypothetical protein [Cytobacillus luteolus]MBP1942643.1 cell division protein FtsW (lipid II flippase) [Cytobacillus luteolus]